MLGIIHTANLVPANENHVAFAEHTEMGNRRDFTCGFCGAHVRTKGRVGSLPLCICTSMSNGHK
jgi:hypothetical protein